MHVLGSHEHARGLLELPVRGERHPEGVQVVRCRFAVKRHWRHSLLPARFIGGEMSLTNWSGQRYHAAPHRQERPACGTRRLHIARNCGIPQSFRDVDCPVCDPAMP